MSWLAGAAFVLAVGIACRCSPRLHPRYRAMLWWLASLRLLVCVLPIAPLTFEVLPPSRGEDAQSFAHDAPVPSFAQTGIDLPNPAKRLLDVPWQALLWGCGVALCAASALRSGVRIRGWLRRGAQLPDPAWTATIERLAARAGLSRAPRVRIVADLRCPLVVGLVRPTVLFPADGLAHLAPSQIEMALAHELAHVARRDLWLGLVPWLVRRVLFFHPLAWLVEREYAIAREAACDAEVLALPGVEPAAYGQLLLAVGGRRAVAMTAALSPRSILRRRLEMIESGFHPRSAVRRYARALVVIAALALVPVRLAASSLPPPPPAPPPSPDFSPPRPPEPPPSPERCLPLGSSEDTAFVLTRGASHTMCGDSSDVRAAERARGDGDDILWFRIGDDAWVIRDRGTLAEAHALFATQADLASRPAIAGADAAALSERAVTLAERQVRLAKDQAANAARQADLALRKMHAARDGGGEGLDPEMETLSEEIAALSARMAALSEELGSLGARGSAIGAEQERRADEMLRRTSDAERDLGRLIEKSLESGTAKKVP